MLGHPPAAVTCTKQDVPFVGEVQAGGDGRRVSIRDGLTRFEHA